MPDAPGVGFWDWDVATNVVQWSDELYRIYGLVPDELTITPESFLERVHPDDRDRVQSSVQGALRDGKPFAHDERIVRPDGTIRYLETRGDTLRDQAGHVTGLLGTCRDVTAHRRREQLRESEHQVLELVVSGAPLGEILDALARLFERQVPGARASVLLLEDGRRLRHGAGPSLPAGWIQVVDGEPIGPQQGSCGTAAYLGQRVVVTDIETDPLWVDYREAALAHGLRACWSEPIVAGDGSVLGTFAFYYTERRGPRPGEIDLIEHAGRLAAIAITHHRHEEALAASETRARLVYDHVADVLFELQIEGERFRFGAANPAFYRATGLRPDQVIGKLVEEVIPEPSRSMVLAKYAEAILARRTVRWEETTVYPAGTRYGDVAVTPVFGADGRPSALIGSVRDITEQRRMENEVRQLQKMEAVGRLSGGVAHDFNNVLGVILGAGQMLLEDLAAGEQRELAREIVDAAARGANLTRQILAFSRKHVLQPKIVDVNDVVRAVEPMLRRLIPENITLVTTTAAATWTVRADPGQLEQVVLNLVVNARDAMPTGGSITIATDDIVVDDAFAAAHHGVVPGEHVGLAVSDTGHGMDEETQRRIFEPFFTTKDVGKGTGLGLATVYGIVTQGGGHILVESAVGHGTTFRIFLPRGAPDESGAGRTGRRDSGIRRLAHLRVLVVEDEPALRATVGQMLGHLQCKARVTADAEEAWAAVESGAFVPDVLMTDLVLPGMAGTALIERVRQVRPEVSVVLMSGYADRPLTEVNLSALDAAFLAKPFGFDELTAGLKAAIGSA